MPITKTGRESHYFGSRPIVTTTGLTLSCLFKSGARGQLRLVVRPFSSSFFATAVAVVEAQEVAPYSKISSALECLSLQRYCATAWRSEAAAVRLLKKPRDYSTSLLMLEFTVTTECQCNITLY